MLQNTWVEGGEHRHRLCTKGMTNKKKTAGKGQGPWWQRIPENQYQRWARQPSAALLSSGRVALQNHQIQSISHDLTRFSHQPWHIGQLRGCLWWTENCNQSGYQLLLHSGTRVCLWIAALCLTFAEKTQNTLNDHFGNRQSNLTKLSIFSISTLTRKLVRKLDTNNISLDINYSGRRAPNDQWLYKAKVTKAVSDFEHCIERQ